MRHVLPLLLAVLLPVVATAGAQEDAQARAAVALALALQAPCSPQAPPLREDCHDELIVHVPGGIYLLPDGRRTNYIPPGYQIAAPSVPVGTQFYRPTYYAAPRYSTPPRAYQGGYRGSGGGSCGPRG